ncbi:GNAT superfamily N-acetyltransferase [Streptomyces sp. B1I3]|nr:GNAT superfamily N-acetyltransferase [Streptomyces sp. B1I3]
MEQLPTAAGIAEASAELVNPSASQVLVEHNARVIGYSTIRWWPERNGTWLYLHRGSLLPEHRGKGVGSGMLSRAENRIRRHVQQHGTAETPVLGANAMASEDDATGLLLEAGYRRVFSLVELELADLRRLPGHNGHLAVGIGAGAVKPT